MVDYAADDVAFIAKRLKEIEEEKLKAIASQPLEQEECSNSPMWGIEASGLSIDTTPDDPFWSGFKLEKQADGSWKVVDGYGMYADA